MTNLLRPGQVAHRPRRRPPWTADHVLTFTQGGRAVSAVDSTCNGPLLAPDAVSVSVETVHIEAGGNVVMLGAEYRLVNSHGTLKECFWPGRTAPDAVGRQQHDSATDRSARSRWHGRRRGL